MANEEHLARLKQGVEAWNAWRSEHKEIRPDLTRADLTRAHLVKANLAWADLTGADLTGADLTGADLIRAELYETHLREAHLRGGAPRRSGPRYGGPHQGGPPGADLTGADFLGAYVSRERTLPGRISPGCTSAEVDLSEAILSRVRIGWTTFGDVDLSMVQGLDTVRHDGPSTIGIDTLYRSHGNIPEVFLRGTGVPEDIITYMKSLVGRPFEFYSCFISYSSQDQEFAERLHADLQSKGSAAGLLRRTSKVAERSTYRSMKPSTSMNVCS